MDTIAAIATAAGRGGIGIVRISGKDAVDIGKKLLGRCLPPRRAVFSHIKSPSGQHLDSGITLFFPAPASFTGEDVIEIHAHGGFVVLDQILKAIFECGARMALPGEFSERAFLNNKIDLAQAEAIADLIAADTFSAAQAAQASLQGVFSKEVNLLVDQLIALRAYIEAALDFPEEEIDFLDDKKIFSGANNLKQQLQIIFKEARQGSLITEGVALVIVGRPNAGKSSLLNMLSGRDSAIVTPVAGTTRDVLREHIQIDGLPLHIIDTAGLHKTNDPIEREGIRRAIDEIKKSDRILFLVDSCDASSSSLSLSDVWPSEHVAMPVNIPITKIFNKCDLSGLTPAQSQSSVTLSAKTGDGLDLLKKHLTSVMGFSGAGTGRYSARRRHLDALQEAEAHVDLGLQLLLSQSIQGELLAEELRLAQNALEAITGRFTPDNLLDKIFRDFVLGNSF